MNKLNITQSNTIESVNSNIIDSLYFNAKTISNNTGTLQGNINSLNAYKDAVDYLRSNYPNLIINVTDNKYYIRFEDPKVLTLLLNYVGYKGDGIGVTNEDAKTIMITRLFSEEPITSFNELPYFINQITTNTDNLRFNGCTKLVSVDISDNLYLSRQIFQTCNKLEYFHGKNSTSGLLDLSNIVDTKVSAWAFEQCFKLKHVILSNNIVEIDYGSFAECTSLIEIENIENITKLGKRSFFWMYIVNIIKFTELKYI